MKKTTEQTRLDAAPGAVADGRWPHPLTAIVLVVALFLLSQVIAQVLVVMLISLGGGGPKRVDDVFASSVLPQFAVIFAMEALALGGLAAYLSGNGIGRRQLGLIGRPGLHDAGWSVAAFLVYWLFNIVATILAQAVPGLDINQKQDIGFDNASGLVPLSLVFVALVVVAPVAEEVLMRGFLFGAVRRHAGFWVTGLVVSAVFASLHLFGGEPGTGLLWIAAIDTFVLSMVLCYVREKTGRLWPCIGLHALKNLAAFISLFIVKMHT